MLHVVLAEAGGVVLDRLGNGLCYNKMDLHNLEFFVHAGSDEWLLQVIEDLAL